MADPSSRPIESIPVLVDVDNLSPKYKDPRHAALMADVVLSAIAGIYPRDFLRAHMRLYGGWYEGSNRSLRADQLAQALQEVFPGVITVRGMKVRVIAELAYSLQAAPDKQLHFTYRTRDARQNVGCLPTASVCSRPVCALAAMESFLQTKCCPEPTCATKPESILYRSQQKMVDAMLAADLIFLARTGPVAVVSSDDDFWPGIRLATHLGGHVIHVRPKPLSEFGSTYRTSLGPRYFEVSLT